MQSSTQPPLDRRLVPLPAEHLEYLRDITTRRGLRAAGKILGLPRDTLARCIATGACMPGTAALLREAIRRRDEVAEPGVVRP